MTFLLTEEEVAIELAAKLDGRRGQQTRLASQLGVPQGTISNVLTQGRGIGDDLAAKLGLRRVVMFEPID